MILSFSYKTTMFICDKDHCKYGWLPKDFYHLIILLLKGYQWIKFDGSRTKWVQTIHVLKWQHLVYSWFPEFPWDWPCDHKIINGLQFLGGIYTDEPVLCISVKNICSQDWEDNF